MPELVEADRSQILRIYRESHALWGAGLGVDDYLAAWDEISATEWAVRHSTFSVWGDPGGDVLSSLKLYRQAVRLEGRSCRAAVLGSIFTPAAYRGRGHAAQLIRAVLERSRRAGDDLALLFTDIGTAYYEAFGFRALPAQEHWGRLPRRSAVPEGVTTRLVTADDRRWIAQAHSDSTAHRPLAVLRDREHWEYLDVRSSAFFRRVRDRKLQASCRAVLEGAAPLAYVTAVEGRGEWTVREVAALGGRPETVAWTLGVAASQARAAGLRRYYGWFPPDVVDKLRDWRMRSGPRRRAQPMVAALDPTLDLRGLESAVTGFIPYLDQF